MPFNPGFRIAAHFCRRWHTLTPHWPDYLKRQFLATYLLEVNGPFPGVLGECLLAMARCRQEPGPDLRLLIAHQDACHEVVGLCGCPGAGTRYNEALSVAIATQDDADLAVLNCVEHLDDWRAGAALRATRLLEKVTKR